MKQRKTDRRKTHEAYNSKHISVIPIARDDINLCNDPKKPVLQNVLKMKQVRAYKWYCASRDENSGNIKIKRMEVPNMDESTAEDVKFVLDKIKVAPAKEGGDVTLPEVKVGELVRVQKYH